MKQSMIIGIVMLYIICQGITMIIQADSTGSSSIWGVFDNVYRMELSQNVISSAVSSVFAPAAYLIAALFALGDVILMRYPAIFSGTYVWAWWIIFMPIAVSFLITIALSVRGVSST